MRKVKSAKIARRKIRKYSWQKHYRGAIVHDDFRFDIEEKIEENFNPSSRDFGKKIRKPTAIGLYGHSPLIPLIVADEIYKAAINAPLWKIYICKYTKKEEKKC